MEKGPRSKVVNKYTLKIKSCGNGTVDDGYKWRKYGQKAIKNCPYSRSYHRCINYGCIAKRQVEQSRDDPDTLIITYEGLHLHYAYSHLLLGKAEDANQPATNLKTTISEAQVQSHKDRTKDDEKGSPENFFRGPSQGKFVDYQEERSPERIGPQGLLEDVVPLMVRSPSNNNTHFSSNSSSYSSCPSPPISPPSLCWHPDYSFSSVRY